MAIWHCRYFIGGAYIIGKGGRVGVTAIVKAINDTRLVAEENPAAEIGVTFFSFSPLVVISIKTLPVVGTGYSLTGGMDAGLDGAPFRAVAPVHLSSAYNS